MDEKKEQEVSDLGAMLFRKRRTLSRILAMQFVFQADLKNNWEAASIELKDFKELAQTPYEEGEHAPFTEGDFKAAWKYADTLIRGVLEIHGELDAMIADAAQNWTFHRISLLDRSILRVAAFEILKSPNGVTPAIAINEAVEIAKSYSINNSSRFVNGILDKIRKTLTDGEKPDQEASPGEKTESPLEPPIDSIAGEANK